MCRLCPDHPNELFLPDLDWAGMSPDRFVTETCALIAQANNLTFDGHSIYIYTPEQFNLAVHSMENMGCDDSWFPAIMRRFIGASLH